MDGDIFHVAERNPNRTCKKSLQVGVTYRHSTGNSGCNPTAARASWHCSSPARATVRLVLPLLSVAISAELSKLLPAGHVFRTSIFANQSDADIEDLLGRPMFRYLFNGCLQLSGRYEFPEAKSATAPMRLIKEADEFNAALPPSASQFDHYMPVEFLNGIPQEKISAIPGLEDALARFEKLFTTINKLTIASTANP
jgi:hypothetical protein